MHVLSKKSYGFQNLRMFEILKKRKKTSNDNLNRLYIYINDQKNEIFILV